eukprot:scpid33191/ scgid18731/ 
MCQSECAQQACTLLDSTVQSAQHLLPKLSVAYSPQRFSMHRWTNVHTLWLISTFWNFFDRFISTIMYLYLHAVSSIACFRSVVTELWSFQALDCQSSCDTVGHAVFPGRNHFVRVNYEAFDLVGYDAENSAAAGFLCLFKCENEKKFLASAKHDPGKGCESLQPAKMLYLPSSRTKTSPLSHMHIEIMFA